MKKKSWINVLLIAGSLMVSNPAHALFTNGGFESGDFTGWSVSGSGAPLSTVMSAATPMLTGQTSDIDPYYGSYMARLQDLYGGYHVTTLSQSDTITGADLSEDLYVRWGLCWLSHPIPIRFLLSRFSILRFSGTGRQLAHSTLMQKASKAAGGLSTDIWVVRHGTRLMSFHLI